MWAAGLVFWLACGSAPNEALPGCTSSPCTHAVTFYGDDDGDSAGHFLDAADVDGDGFSEALVSENARFRSSYTEVSDVNIHVLSFPMSGQELFDAAYVSYTGVEQLFGRAAVLLPATQQVAVQGVLENPLSIDFSPHFYAFPPGPAGLVTTEDVAYSMSSPQDRYAQDLYERCTDGDGLPALCIVTISSVPPPELLDQAGQVLLHRLPVTPGAAIDGDALARYYGDPYDAARRLTEGDFDGDGAPDLVVGAFQGLTVLPGKVGILTARPPGEHRIWDVADAVIDGVAPGGEFGLGLAAGDLDQDGTDDVFVGAPIGDSPQAYVFRAPKTGTRSALDAEWHTSSGVTDEWVGYSGAIGDFDGDAIPDLAVAAPWSVYLGFDPGRVMLWSAPSVGELDLASPDQVFISGSEGPDSFGVTMTQGDLGVDPSSQVAVMRPFEPHHTAPGAPLV